MYFNFQAVLTRMDRAHKQVGRTKFWLFFGKKVNYTITTGVDQSTGSFLCVIFYTSHGSRKSSAYGGEGDSELCAFPNRS